MATVLYIKANAKPEGESRTFKISDSFIEAYKREHPEDEIITLDLYKEGIGPLKPEDIPSVLAKEKDRNDPVLKYAYQFIDADKYVIAAPLWNLSVPGIIKCYVDYACLGGLCFHYTPNGPVGHLQGKKAIHITTRGGDYSSFEMQANEMGDKYLKNQFAIYGIEDYQTLAVDMMDVWGTDVEKMILDAIDKAQAIAKDF